MTKLLHQSVRCRENLQEILSKEMASNDVNPRLMKLARQFVRHSWNGLIQDFITRVIEQRASKTHFSIHRTGFLKSDLIRLYYCCKNYISLQGASK